MSATWQPNVAEIASWMLYTSRINPSEQKAWVRTKLVLICSHPELNEGGVGTEHRQVNSLDDQEFNLYALRRNPSEHSI